MRFFSVRYLLLLFAFVGLHWGPAAAQDTYDTAYYSEDHYVDDANLYVKPDSAAVQTRAFDDKALSTLRDDEDLQYKQPPTIAESIFDRAMQLIAEFIDSLFAGAVSRDWGRLISYLIGLGLIVVAILMLLKVNAFKVFYGTRESAVQYSVVDENIHEMDFEKLIGDAIAQNEYRRATRLVFLHALKLLADRGLIQWEMGKTNHDYLLEVKHEVLKPGFHQLNYFFEYAWYGNFNVTREKFLKVQQVFNVWRKEMR